MELEQFPQARPAPTDRPTSVLVVDDDASLRKAVRRVLEADGLTVDEAGGGVAALARLRAAPADVVVSDVDMPDGDGLTLLRSIREIDLDLPVLMISGLPQVQAAATALEYGAFRYLVKPLDFGRLVADVRLAARALTLARLRREAVTAAGGEAALASDRAGLEVRVGRALASLWPSYQPVIGARSGVLFGVEALLRTDEASLPDPRAVVDAASRCGRGRELGRRMRARAATGLRDAPANLFLFVNLVPDDLFDDDLLRDDAPLTAMATRVVLELSERDALVAHPALPSRLAMLRALGYRFALDDVGAGLSGLGAFTEVVPEVVKLDPSLVRNVHDHPHRQRAVRAMAGLCHDSGSLVVAEGVESGAEVACLRELGCDLLQGYFYARPARELPRWRTSATLAALREE